MSDKLVNKADLAKSNKGFTLIELSIVIIILSLIIAPLFAMLQAQKKEQEVVQEETVNERVVAALALFLRQNSRYPCPANRDLGPGDANFGGEQCTAGVGTGVVMNGGVLIGALPVKALNLPFQSAANSHGWKYIYAITDDLTDTTTFDGVGNIEIVDKDNNPFVAQPVPFVIANPGKDGKGANNLYGGASGIGCLSTARDAENCDDDRRFREADFATKSSLDDPEFYDDTISYTLAREESTFWVVRESGGTGGGLDISNRNIGNVGIGTDQPEEKMHVTGGNIRVQADGGTGGNVKVDKEIEAQGEIRAKKDVKAEGRVVAPTFYYDATP